MPFSINTNITSLSAQNYLLQSSNFQNQTINEVTSGLRIVNSGDDAAGLAVANGLASDQAVLTQGVQNANQGLTTLQTIDGGMSNISTLIDRAQTLATESASGTFSGSRTTLNTEFQSVLSEINRQAQSIGLNTGGQYDKALSVYIGGGQGSTAAAAAANGTINMDLSKSAVDAQALGLNNYAVTGNSASDIGTGSAHDSVASIIAQTNNTEATAGSALFYVSGAGYGGSNRIALSVNLNGVTDTTSLANAINSAIASAGAGGTQAATAFKNANIVAGVNVSSTGTSQLQFTSANGAFQVEAGDQMANALFGNFSTASTATGETVAAYTATTNQSAVSNAGAGAAETVKLAVTTGGTTTAVGVTVSANDTRAQLLADVQAGLTTAGITGVTAQLDSNNKLQFVGAGGSSVSVTGSGDVGNLLGMGTWIGNGSTASYTSLTAGAAIHAADTQNVQIAIGNQVADLGALSTGAAEVNAISALNTAFQGNALTSAAGLEAIDNGGKIEITSANSTAFRINMYGDATAGFGFAAGGAGATAAGLGAAVGTSQTTAASGTNADSPSLDAQGVSTSGDLNFQGIAVGGLTQNITFSANDASGAAHSISLNLSNSNASNIDQAINTINTDLQQSNDSTLNQIVAVKDQSSGVDGIRFVSALSSFNVNLGTTAAGTGSAGVIEGISNGTGTSSQGQTVSSTVLGTAASANVSTVQAAEAAINALQTAVSTFGNAQAAVGRGENLLNYATNLANSEVTNEAAAESAIKDANLAQEAANLSKAQILVQAGTAALAQANSAPQQLLALLQH